MADELNTATKKSMSVREMGSMLGLKKVESYWLVHKEYFETVLVNGKMRVMVDSFEKWYRSQFHYKKVNGEPPGSDYDYTMSIQEFADLLGISGASAYYIVDAQRLQTVIINGRKQIYKDEVFGWIEAHPAYKEMLEREREKKWKQEQLQYLLTEPGESAATLSKK